MPLHHPHPLDVQEPLFSVVVQFPKTNVDKAEIPYRLIEEQQLLNLELSRQPGQLCGAIMLYLYGLPGARWNIGLTSLGSTVWMDGGWESFLNCIRDHEGKLVLIFRYKGDGRFTVLRFRSDGSLICRNPRPPFGYRGPMLEPYGSLTLPYHAFTSDAFAEEGDTAPPIIRQGTSLHSSLIEDGVPSICCLRWPLRGHAIFWFVQLILVSRKGISFGLGWERFRNHNNIDDKHICVFKYRGGLKFSVLVFHTVTGMLTMKVFQFGEVPPPGSDPPLLLETDQPENDLADQVPHTDGLVLSENGRSPHYEPVVPNHRALPSCLVTVYENHARFNSTETVFSPSFRGFVKMQRSDGAVWVVGVVPNGGGHHLSKNFKAFRQANSLEDKTKLQLFIVNKRTFVFDPQGLY